MSPRFVYPPMTNAGYYILNVFFVVFWHQTRRFGRQFQLQTSDHLEVDVQKATLPDWYRSHIYRTWTEKWFQSDQRSCPTWTSHWHSAPFPFAPSPHGLAQVFGLVLPQAKNPRWYAWLDRRCSYSAQAVQKVLGAQVPRQVDWSFEWPLRKGQSLQLEDSRRRRIIMNCFFNLCNYILSFSTFFFPFCFVPALVVRSHVFSLSLMLLLVVNHIVVENNDDKKMVVTESTWAADQWPSLGSVCLVSL